MADEPRKVEAEVVEPTAGEKALDKLHRLRDQKPTEDTYEQKAALWDKVFAEFKCDRCGGPLGNSGGMDLFTGRMLCMKCTGGR